METGRINLVTGLHSGTTLEIPEEEGCAKEKRFKLIARIFYIGV
jgi:hypothetical protein